MKIGQYLAKICTKLCGLLFWATLYIYFALSPEIANMRKGYNNEKQIRLLSIVTSCHQSLIHMTRQGNMRRLHGHFTVHRGGHSYTIIMVHYINRAIKNITNSTQNNFSYLPVMPQLQTFLTAAAAAVPDKMPLSAELCVLL